MLGQAKKIIKSNNDVDESRLNRKDILYSLDIYNKPQPLGTLNFNPPSSQIRNNIIIDSVFVLGFRRSHFEIFKEIRNHRVEGFSAETNKLIIRLDKLLTNVPSDPARRKCMISCSILCFKKKSYFIIFKNNLF